MSTILSRRRPVQWGGIVAILLPTDEIITTLGYNPDTGLILNVEGEWPALMDNATAVSELEYVFADFPFDGPSHFAACLTALLTLLLSVSGAR